MTKIFIAIALTISFSLNTLALYEMVNILKKYNIKDSKSIDRSLRKAYVSKKKLEIASTQVRKLRSRIFKVTLYQFFIPMLTFLSSIIIYTFLTAYLFPEQSILIVTLNKPCIAPIPIMFPLNTSACSMQISWLFFLIFLLYLPLYTYYTKKYLES